MSAVAVDDFARDRAATDTALRIAGEQYLTGVPPRVADAIRYSLSGGGKRLRALLFFASYRAAGGDKNASALSAAIEIVHAYSLVHDDLPCMDDDDVRRGRPTVHKAFDVRTATAAGLAMVPLAARVALDGSLAIGLSLSESGEIVRALMHASGASGMVGGQLLDLEGENEALSLERLERIHSLKTGALICAAARLGGLAAQASVAQRDALDAYGRAVGLAFQIADDVLDVTATTEALGKTAGKDLSAHKSTYPALLGVAGAVERANSLAEEACAALDRVGLLTTGLSYLARYAVARSS